MSRESGVVQKCANPGALVVIDRRTGGRGRGTRGGVGEHRGGTRVAHYWRIAW